MKNTESILINRLKDGDEKAFEQVFYNYYEALTIYAYKFLGDLEESKEVIQDLFVSIYEKRSNLQIDSSIKAYLYRAVHNRCLNIINREKYVQKHQEYVKRTKMQRRMNEVEQHMRTSELEQIIYKMIDQLPPKCKEIFKMNRFDGKKNGEIAKELGLSKRTVETQISKALKILRSKLVDYDLGFAIAIILFITGYVY